MIKTHYPAAPQALQRFGAAGAAPVSDIFNADTLEAVMADDDVKKALSAFREHLSKPREVARKDGGDKDGDEKDDKKSEPHKGFWAKAQPVLALLGTLLMALLGVVFRKPGGVVIKP